MQLVKINQILHDQQKKKKKKKKKGGFSLFAVQILGSTQKQPDLLAKNVSQILIHTCYKDGIVYCNLNLMYRLIWFPRKRKEVQFNAHAIFCFHQMHV